MKKLLIMVGVLVFLFVGYAGAEPYRDVCIDNPNSPICKNKNVDGAEAGSIASTNSHGGDTGGVTGGDTGGDTGGSHSGLGDGSNPGHGGGGPHGEGNSRGNSNGNPGHDVTDNPGKGHGRGGDGDRK